MRVAEQLQSLNQKLIDFITNQQIYFVGTAGAKGFINVSPKGMDSFRVVDESTVVWLNLTGSGNESAAHVLENGRMTVMFCSFDKQPLILRLYGQARAIHPRDTEWNDLATQFPEHTGARQFFKLNIELVQTSCGYAVPFYEYKGERPTLKKWADKHGKEGIEQYWKDNNVKSLDGKETGILEDA